MKRLIRGLSILVVLFAIVVYARDCRMSFNMWKHCGGDAGKAAILGDYVKFDWNYAGLFSPILHVQGKPAARLLHYDFGLSGDVIEVSSLDGTQTSRYCGK